MTFPMSGAHRAPDHRIVRLARMVALAFLAAAILPAMAPAQPVSAASCGTNWTSKRLPPPTIRVLDTRTHNVVVVDFRDYVSLVMASGEFPTYDPKAVLEAGATAVKQYGWYYTLQGHHRSSYRTAAGVCYDVRDDTNDQLFRPRYATPTQKQLDAVATTWGLTLRKSGRFFLTGYRYGGDVACASDSDHWRLYERSMVDCAKKGWDRQKIQEAYYRPNIQFVWADTQPAGSTDTTAPSVTRPRVTLRQGATLGRVVLTLTWNATDKGSGVAGYTLQHRGRHGWRNIMLSKKTATAVTLSLRSNRRQQFRVRAIDAAGNVSAFATGRRLVPRVVQTADARLSGAWTVSHDPAASGGSTRFAVGPGATATLRFRGQGIGLVAQLGPNRGQASILIDGKQAGTIDLQSASRAERRVVFTQRWNVPGIHTISVKVLGTQGRPRVDLDAFVILR